MHMPYKIFIIKENKVGEPEVAEYTDIESYIFYGKRGNQIKGQANVRAYSDVRSLGGAFFAHMDKIRHLDPERLKDISFAEKVALTIRNGWKRADAVQKIMMTISLAWLWVFILSLIAQIVR